MVWSPLPGSPATLFLAQYEPKKCLADDDLVAVIERLSVSWQQTRPPVDEGPVGASQILDQVLVVREGNACMPSRDLCFRIVLVEIDVGKDATIRIPSPDQQFALRRQLKFPTLAAGRQHHQPSLFLPIWSLSIWAPPPPDRRARTGTRT